MKFSQILLFNKLEYYLNKIFHQKLSRVIYSSEKRPLNLEKQANIQIRIYDNFLFRWLSFGGTAIQSKMTRLAKFQPCLPVFHALSFSGLLYKLINNKELNNSKHSHSILILGLGGGDLLRFYYKYFNLKKNKNISVKVIEKYSEVINIAKEYFYLSKIIAGNNNILLQQQDAYDYLNSSITFHYNIIVIDFFTEVNSALELSNPNYISKLHSILNNNGVLVINTLFSNEDTTASFIDLVNKVFKNNIFILSSPNHYNVLIFAFKKPDYLNIINNSKNNDKIAKLLAQYFTNPKQIPNKGYKAEFKQF